MTPSPPDDDNDYRDGMCDLDFEVTYPTPDADVPWVVLFADNLDATEHVRDLDAVRAEAKAWHQLFDQEMD